MKVQCLTHARWPCILFLVLLIMVQAYFVEKGLQCVCVHVCVCVHACVCVYVCACVCVVFCLVCRSIKHMIMFVQNLWLRTDWKWALGLWYLSYNQWRLILKGNNTINAFNNNNNEYLSRPLFIYEHKALSYKYICRSLEQYYKYICESEKHQTLVPFPSWYISCLPTQTWSH